MKQVILKAYDDALQQLKETSWVIIDNSTDGDLRVTYFNNDEAAEDFQFSSFKDFFETYLDDAFEDFDEREKHINENVASATGSTSSTEEDFDEDSRRTWETIVTKAQVIDGYNGIKLNELEKLIQASHKSLKNIECDSSEREADSQAYHKDPYAYHGVSKKDFL